MTAPTPPPPPGWYADPWAQQPLRFWDGTRWTPHTAASADAPLPAAVQVPGPVEPPKLPGRYAGLAVLTLVSAIAAEFAVALALRDVLHLPILLDFMVIGVVLYGILLLPARTIAAATGQSWADAFGLRGRLVDVPSGVIVFIISTLASIIAATPFASHDRFQGNNTGVLERYRDHLLAYVLLGVMAVVVAPIFEELFFRGVLLRTFNDRLGPKYGNAAQAALFGLVHIQPLAGTHNVTVVVSITAAGLVLGWSANRYGRLAPGMVGHALRNTLALAVVLAR